MYTENKSRKKEANMTSRWNRGLPLVFMAVLTAIPHAGQSQTMSGLPENGIGDRAALTVVPATAATDAFAVALASEISMLNGSGAADIAAFYAANDYQPFWTAAESDRLTQLMSALDEAEAHGMPYLRYNADALALLSESTSPEDRPTLELAATRSYLRFAGDLTAGFLTPSAIDEEISLKPKRASGATLLSHLNTGGSVTDVLQQTEPSDPGYRQLMAEAARLRAVSGSTDDRTEVADGETLRIGDSGVRVLQLRQRMDELGYAAPADPGTEAIFDDGLHQAVAEFQSDNGLVDDGAAGRRTLAAANASAEQQLRQVLVNLERMRWMNHDLGNRRIMVNIPDYTAVLYEGDSITWQSRTVVGKSSDTRTPEFSDEMSYLVVNPTWHIPDSIATRVYLPKLRNDPTVLANSNMRLFTRSGVEINPRLVNFSQYTSANFPFRVKQNPSSANALGRVKFMFPNQFSIYLHDTPSRNLFAKDARAFSNGCIRLEQPVELAEVLLAGQFSDPDQAFDGWLAAKSERHVNLDRPVTVHILYRTAWADPDGTVRYRDDVYGRDAKVFEAMEAKGVRSNVAAAG
jgi:L,D-transpeptidase YcbB